MLSEIYMPFVGSLILKETFFNDTKGVINRISLLTSLSIIFSTRFYNFKCLVYHHNLKILGKTSETRTKFARECDKRRSE